MVILREVLVQVGVAVAPLAEVQRFHVGKDASESQLPVGGANKPKHMAASGAGGVVRQDALSACCRGHKHTTDVDEVFCLVLTIR